MAGQPIGRRNWKLETRNWKLVSNFQSSIFNFQFVCGAALLCAILILSLGSGLSTLGRLFGYSPEQDDVNGAPTPAKWQDTPIHWQINPSVGSNVLTAGGVSVTTALRNAFNTWQSSQLNNQSLTSISFTQDANTSQTDPDASDCLDTVSFVPRSEEHTSELQSRLHLVCRLLLEKKKRLEAHHGTG